MSKNIYQIFFFNTFCEKFLKFQKILFLFFNYWNVTNFIWTIKKYFVFQWITVPCQLSLIADVNCELRRCMVNNIIKSLYELRWIYLHKLESLNKISKNDEFKSHEQWTLCIEREIGSVVLIFLRCLVVRSPPTSNWWWWYVRGSVMRRGGEQDGIIHQLNRYQYWYKMLLKSKNLTGKNFN